MKFIFRERDPREARWRRCQDLQTPTADLPIPHFAWAIPVHSRLTLRSRKIVKEVQLHLCHNRRSSSRAAHRQPLASARDKMAAIGSLVFCTDCGTLLDANTGRKEHIECDVCGTLNKGEHICGMKILSMYLC